MRKKILIKVCGRYGLWKYVWKRLSVCGEKVCGSVCSR